MQFPQVIGKFQSRLSGLVFGEPCVEPCPYLVLGMPVSVPVVGIGVWRASTAWNNSESKATFQSRLSGLVFGER